jgi:hypothetical protein
MLTQSFLRGVIRCGGIGIRLRSDVREALNAEAGSGGKAGAEEA